jgi:predicted DNA-binding WGR domain protein
MATADQRVISSDYLHCQTRGSDKVYDLELVREADGTYSVNACYGRRGSTLNSAPKCQHTTLDVADREYNKLIEEKLGKGYQRRGITTPHRLAPPPSAPVRPAARRRKAAAEAGFTPGMGRKLVLD